MSDAEQRAQVRQRRSWARAFGSGEALLDRNELALILNCSRQETYRVQERSPDFPTPVPLPGGSRKFRLRSKVNEWMRNYAEAAAGNGSTLS